MNFEHEKTLSRHKNTKLLQVNKCVYKDKQLIENSPRNTLSQLVEFTHNLNRHRVRNYCARCARQDDTDEEDLSQEFRVGACAGGGGGKLGGRGTATC